MLWVVQSGATRDHSPHSQSLEAVVQVLKSLQEEAPPVDAHLSRLNEMGVQNEDWPEDLGALDGRQKGRVVMDTKALAEPVDSAVVWHLCVV